MNKFVLASLLGAAVMFAGQAPATSGTAPASSQPAATTKVKKHHKKTKTAPATSTSATPSKPAAKQ
jgi:hypothetical protein